MPVFYRLNQNTNEKSSAHNKWYARSVMTSVVDTEKLAEIMQRNCTVKRSDIKTVIEELIETMRDQLQDSKRVKLDGLGSFKLGLSSKGAEKASDFDARHHIRGVHVVFTPETTTDSTGRRSKTFLEGVTVAELPKNMVVTDGSEEGGEG